MDPEIRTMLDLLDQRFGVACLWLFGSKAAGRERPDSDLDLACLFRERPEPEELLEMRAGAEALIGRPVDVVDLDGASPILAWQVLNRGRLLVDRDPSRRHRFTALAPGRREDLLITRRPVEEALIARVEGGGVDG